MSIVFPQISGTESNGRILLHKTTADLTHTGNTDATSLTSFVVPGGLMTANSMLLMECALRLDNGSLGAPAGTGTIQIFWGANATYTNSGLAAATDNLMVKHVLTNNGATTTQWRSGSTNSQNNVSPANDGNWSRDTGDDQTVSFTVTLSNGADTIRLRYSLVELIL